MVLSMLLILFDSRQLEAKRRAVVETRVEVDGSVEFAGEFGGDIEAETGPAGFSGTVVFGAVEFAKNLGLIGFANANARVAHGKC